MRRTAVVISLVAAMALALAGMASGATGTSSSVMPTVTRSKGAAATIDVDPLRIALKLTLTSVRAGTLDTAVEKISNHGNAALTNVATLLIAPQAVVVRPARGQAIGTLAAGGTTTAQWTLCATTAGTYVAVAWASAHEAAGQAFVGYSPPQRLVITKGSGRC